MLNAHTSPSQLFKLRDEVFDEWVTLVRREVQYAKQVSKPVLTDTLPVFYEHLIKLVCNESVKFDNSTIAAEHGGERARLTRFDADSIIHEFHLFRASIFAVWERNGVDLTIGQINIVASAIDTALRESVTGFVMTQTALREQFFSALTHDLRTPLGTSSMAAEMIRSTDTSERVQRLATVISKQHELMSQMITDLLDTMVLNVSNSRACDIEQFDLGEIVQQVIGSAMLSSGRSVNAQVESVHGHWNMHEMRRATENLLNNALKYSAARTTIDISLKAYRGRVVLSVCNVGNPIPVDQTEAIFQLFRRANQQKEQGTAGWGIGLPYVRSVAERHAGSIAVESNESQTRFILDVPIDPRPILETAHAVILND